MNTSRASMWPGILAGLLIGCGPVRVADVFERARSEKNIRHFEVGNHRLEIRYLPREYVLLSRAGLDSGRVVTSGLLDSLEGVQGLGEGETFLLKLSPREDTTAPDARRDVVYGPLSGFGGYQRTLEEYQFGWRDKIWLETGHERIPLGGYQMENTFGMDPSRIFMLTFMPVRNGKKTHVVLVLDDLVPGMARMKLGFTLLTGRF